MFVRLIFVLVFTASCILAVEPSKEQLAKTIQQCRDAKIGYYEIKSVYREQPLHTFQLDWAAGVVANDALLKNIPAIDFPHALSVERATFSADGLRQLKQRKNLIGFRTTQSNIAGEHLKALSEFEELEYLDLWYSQALKNDDVAYFKKFKNLRSLHIGGAPLDDKGLEHLAGMTQLTDLSLNFLLKISDAGLKHLKDLVNLKRLNLSDDAKITATGLAELRGIKALEELNLNNATVTDAMAAEIKRHGALKTLDLQSGFTLTNTGIKELAGLKELRALNIASSKLTDDGLKELVGLENLVQLDLRLTHITDASLDQLKGYKKIKKLELFGTGVTEDGVAKLRKALPDCHIRFKPFD